MDQFVHSKIFKTTIIIIIILTIPFWLTILNYIFLFLIHAGRIIGTYIRIIADQALIN